MNQIERFFEALGRDDTERLSLNGIHNDRFRSVIKTVALLKQNPPSPDLDRWYGTAVLGKVETGRGRETAVVGVRELYLDLDVKPGGMATAEDAFRAVGELSKLLGTVPAAVVHTGHGYQPHWRIERGDDTDWPDATDPRWTAVSVLMKRWHRLAKRVAADHGGKIDDVSDLARVLRVPGTTNRKAEPVRVTAEYPDGAQSVSLKRLAEVLDKAGIGEQDTDRPPSGGIVSLPGSWGWADESCPYIKKMVDGWADDSPPGGRHQWLQSQAVRLAAAHRYGCLTKDDHTAAVEALGKRFDEVLSAPPVRSPGRGEVDDCLDWGVTRVAGMTSEAVAKELGLHDHGEAGPDALDEEAFWTSRERLTRLRDHARAQMVGPWAMLGATLALVACHLGAKVVLPPLGVRQVGGQGRGGIGSLNLLVGLVGPPGAGKDLAIDAARASLWVEDDDLPEVKLGTGQGIAALFTRNHHFKKEGNRAAYKKIIQFNDVAFIVAREVGTLAAHAKQASANLIPELKCVYNGSRLGEQYADPEKRRPVRPHQYRAALIVNIQPQHASAILDDQEGGLPQRFLWFETTDPNRPDDSEIGDTLPLDWSPPAGVQPYGDQAGGEVPYISPADRVVLNVCGVAVEEGLALRRKALSAPVDGAGDLEGHSHFTRLKVAALLSVLDGREGNVSEDDWKLSSVVMAHSRKARQVCERAVSQKAAELNRQRATAEGERRVVAADAEADATGKAVIRVAKSLLSKLGTEWVTHGDLRRGLAGRDRRHFDTAVANLESAGAIGADRTDSAKTRYRRLVT